MFKKKEKEGAHLKHHERGTSETLMNSRQYLYMQARNLISNHDKQTLEHSLSYKTTTTTTTTTLLLGVSYMNPHIHSTL